MRIDHKLLCSAAAIALLASAGSASAAAADDKAAASKVTTEVDTVIVTAERRAESAQQTPVSVTALSPDEIQKNYVHNLADLTRESPNFTIEGVGATSRSSAVVYSRGLGFSGIDGQEPPAAVSIDGLFYAVNVGTLLNMFDVKQVEILKGPQGTLFGRNTTGGVVQINTNDPTHDFEVSGVLRAGNYGRIDSNLTANLPITSTLAARISINTQNSDGFFTNKYIDPVSNRSLDGTNAGGDNNRSIRGKLRWTPMDDLTVQLTAWYSKQRQHSPVGQNASGPNDLLTLRGRPGIGLPGGPTDPFTVSRDTNGLDNLDQNATVLDINYHTQYGFDVVSITGYLHYKAHELDDFDASDLNFFTSDIFRHRTQYSEELRLQSNDSASRLKWQVGAFFFNTRWESKQANILGPSFFANTTARQPTVSQYLGATTFDANEAVFGQADYEIVPKLTLTLGGRYTFDSKRTTVWPALANLDPPFPAGLQGSQSWDDFTYHVAARYQFNNDLMAYVSYSTGERAGGFLTTATTQSQMTPFAPEKAKALEGGVKSDWLEHRLRVNVTGFWNQYDDLQVGAFRPISGGSGQQAFIANDAFERARGVELEAIAVPIPALRLTADIGYLDAKYTSFVSALSYNFPGHVCNGLTAGPGSPPIEQNHADPNSPCYLVPPRAPEWTVKLQGTYDFDLGSSWGTLTPHVAFSYEDSHYTNLTNAPQGFQKAYSVWDADVTYHDPMSRWRLSLYGKNIGNTVHILNANPIAGLFNANYYADPETYGVELAVTFR
jgi:iron complex outermembrane receptor protein